MDNSFIRFLDNFDKAKDLQNSKLSEFNYDTQIHLKPGESYSLITNCPVDISFGGLYKAYLVNCEDTILADITSNTYIEEFTHDETGLEQIKLELIGITGYDFYTDLVYLRIDHNIVSGKKFWSNAFLFSNYDIDETTRFRFKNYIDLDGTNYKLADVYQSIRLKCYKEKTTFTSSSQSYTTFQGLKYSSRVIKTKMYEIIFDMCNDFIYDRLQYLLTHDIIYIDTVRVTDKQTFESPSKFNGSNIAQVKFKVAVNEDDIDGEAYQVYYNPVLPLLKYDYKELDYDSLDYKTN